MVDNQLSRYGAMSRGLPYLAPNAKLFLVADSDDTTSGAVNVANTFPPDNEGVVRVYTTPQAAINAAAGGRGDVVGILPGYDHSLARADTWATAGVKVIGFGQGGDRPKIRFTVATDRIGVAANNNTIENIEFIADADSVATGIRLDTGFSGHVIRGNKFNWNAALDNFVTTIDVGTPNTLIENNEFFTEDTLGGGAAILLKGGKPDNTVIRNNDFDGYWDTNGDTTNGGGAIGVTMNHDSVSAADTVLIGLRVVNNRITDRDTGASVLINLANGATTVKGSLFGNQLIAFDTAAADSDLIAWGSALGVQNWGLHGDSDIQEAILHRIPKLIGTQDS